MKRKSTNLALALFIALLTFAGLYSIVNLLDINGVIKFFLGVALLVLSGVALKKVLNLEGDLGIILIKDQRGLKTIDKLARKNKALLKVLADSGLVLSFGFLSLFVLKDKRKNLPRTAAIFVFSMLLLLAISLLITPNLFPIASSTITTLDLNSANMKVRESAQGQNVMAFVLLSVLMFGGLMLMTAAGLVSYASVILVAAVNTLVSGSSALATTTPGATLVLPGINLPFIEGVLALAILLVVHEGGHALLARIAKIKLLSAGIAFLGVVPAGAFVDPDEEQMKKKPVEQQNRVLVAGSAFNLYTTIFLFILLILFVTATSPFRSDYLLVEKAEVVLDSGEANDTSRIWESRPVPAGTKITEINGESIGEITNFIYGPNSEVEFTLENGTAIYLAANDEGKVMKKLFPFSVIRSDGIVFRARTLVEGELPPLYARTWNYTYDQGFDWLGFAYATLALACVLNFLVGVVNLLPLPMFDGHRLMTLNVKNKLFTDIITITMALSFLLNFLPWVVK